jgi:hypothetical protein
VAANETRDLWVNEGHAYSVAIEAGGAGTASAGNITKSARSGLSHVEAMVLAEQLRRQGAVVVVLHVIGDKSYEVDRYPAR